MEKNDERVTVVLFFEFPKWYQVYLAFSTMGMKKIFPLKSRGMIFGKMLGNGSGIGFGFRPNFKQYSILAVFDSHENSELFLQENKFLKWMNRISEKSKLLQLKTIRSIGKWDDKNLYPAISENISEKIVVLTRAKLRFRKIPKFWKQVPSTNRSLEEKSGRIFSAGMGEWPLSHPITFSIWENEERMKDFAYNSEAHKNAIKRAREGKWFKEDLFVRYTILKEEGF